MNSERDDLGRLSIPPTPMTLGGYLEIKMADLMVFYGVILVVSMITGAAVAWLLA